MTDDQHAAPPARFTVKCCRARRSLLPSGVLVCLACDGGPRLPKFGELSEVPAGATRWPPGD